MSFKQSKISNLLFVEQVLHLGDTISVKQIDIKLSEVS